MIQVRPPPTVEIANFPTRRKIELKSDDNDLLQYFTGELIISQRSYEASFENVLKI